MTKGDAEDASREGTEDTSREGAEDASGEGEQECWFGEGGCHESSEIESWRDCC